VPTDGFAPAVAERLRLRLRQHLGPHMEVEVEVVDQIDREPSGKRLVIKRHVE
jgi:siroheme synthase (precorrin-2 oxidase/ferrochelatase)